MGAGRDQVFINGVHPDVNHKFNNPGPGHYPVKLNFSQVGVKIPKLNTQEFSHPVMPGPEKYKIPSIFDPKGVNMLSKYKTPGVVRIPQKDSEGNSPQRFKYRSSNLPI